MKQFNNIVYALGLIAIGFIYIFQVIADTIKTMGPILIIISIFILITFIVISIYIDWYFNGDEFNELKQRLDDNTHKCNQLNQHLSDISSLIYLDYGSHDYGHSTYYDSSAYRYKRSLIEQIKNNTVNEYHCSLTVCKNAQNQPFKYLCKYFNIKIDEDTLNFFETIFNNLVTIEEGKEILLKERDDIIIQYSDKIPLIIQEYKRDLFFEKLGHETINFAPHFPKYSFIYISGGGNSSMTCDIILDIENIERFIRYLNEEIQKTKTIKYQRALMTQSLRNEIKARDKYTCQNCGISIREEPHLLLEIDHIIPLSKNGKTTKDNLQTLCWRCNRQKGSRLITPYNNYTNVWQ